LSSESPFILPLKKADTSLLSAYDYKLDDSLIAQHPVMPRDHARLMVDAPRGALEHVRFDALKQYLRAGDLLVFNQTSVLPCRLYAKKPTGGRVELFVLSVTHEANDTSGPSNPWLAPMGERSALVCMTRASKPVRPGTALSIANSHLIATVIESSPGVATVHVPWTGSAADLLEMVGHMPLPPYILAARAASGQEAADTPEDRADYQTVYANPKQAGSVAAPTAGLHFTQGQLDELRERGVQTASITLHVGRGTFIGVSAERLDDHLMHSEDYIVDQHIGRLIASAKARGGRVIAVGTTTARTLEAEARREAPFEPGMRSTDIFLRPGEEPKLIDGLITNLHLPRSTLLALVAAHVGYARMRRLYEAAILERYRFFSYGDAMLLWRQGVAPRAAEPSP
jgi:S-adenosylmethionine:tRNA ribosyltransferase-isomerase